MGRLSHKILLAAAITVAVIILYVVYVVFLALIFEGPFHPPAVPSAHPIVTLAKAKRVQDGMSYQQVVALVGSPGKPLSRYRAGPLPPFTPLPKDFVEYEWRNSDGSRLRVTFDHGKVTGFDESWLR